MKLGIFSGKCLLGICGTPTELKDTWGKELFVGDIIAVVSENYRSDTMTVVAQHGYTTFTNGEIKIEKDLRPFPMGWLNTNPDEVSFLRLKKWSDCIDGEHWTEFGFNYRMFDEERITEESI